MVTTKCLEAIYEAPRAAGLTFQIRRKAEKQTFAGVGFTNNAIGNGEKHSRLRRTNVIMDGICASTTLQHNAAQNRSCKA